MKKQTKTAGKTASKKANPKKSEAKPAAAPLQERKDGERKEKEPRDQKYKYKGESLGKGRFVLALVREWAAANKNASKTELLAAFPDELVGKRYGVVRELKEAEEISKQRKRYFLGEEEVVTVGGRKYAVTNQITGEIVKRIMDHLKEKGLKVK